MLLRGQEKAFWEMTPPPKKKNLLKINKGVECQLIHPNLLPSTATRGLKETLLLVHLNKVVRNYLFVCPSKPISIYIKNLLRHEPMHFFLILGYLSLNQLIKTQILRLLDFSSSLISEMTHI